MKNVLIAGLIAGSAALVPQTVSAQSSDCTVIGSIPATIGSPGKYCMAADAMVDMTVGVAITIASDDVTLDCRDHTLSNAASANDGSSIGIFASSVANIIVRNCRVVGGFTDAIHIHQPMAQYNSAFYYRIEDNYIVGPWRYGIVASGSAVEVRGNKIWDVGGQASGPAVGMRLGGAVQSANKFQIVEDNYILGTKSPVNNAFAIFSDGSIGSVFRDNTISGTAASSTGSFRSYGIRIATGSANTVRDNHILGRGLPNEYGIHLPPAGNLCFHNRVGVSLAPYTGCDTGNGNY